MSTMREKYGLFNLSWIARAIILGIVIGPIITLLTKIVVSATLLRIHYFLLIFLMPLFSIINQWIKDKEGERIENSASNIIALINEKIYAKTDPVDATYDKKTFLDDKGLPPAILAPILLINTFLTHLCGASGGKEGAGVQIGAALSIIFAKIESKLFKKHNDIALREAYLICGAGGAFAALFSAPLAGTLFGILFANPRVNRNETFLPCFATSVCAVITSRLLNIPRMLVIKPIELSSDYQTLIKIALLGIVFGLFGRFFCFFTHKIKSIIEKNTKNKIELVTIASIILLALTFAAYFFTGSFQYSGLSSELITQAGLGLSSPAAPIFKLLLTAFTVVAGFTGGEIVPILVIGSTLGASLAPIVGLPFSCMAVFGAMGTLSSGTKLPLVCFLLGLELFGTTNMTYLFAITLISFAVSGNARIFHAQAPATLDCNF